MSLLGSIVDSVIGGFSSHKAANTEANAAQHAADTAMAMYDQTKALEAPYRTAGLTAQNRLLYLLGLPQAEGAGSAGYGDTTSPDFGKYGRDFSMSDFQADPGYAFRLSEGLKALDRQAAARGGLISGSALKAAERYGQDMGSQEYQNAFNRYQMNRQAALDPLYRLTGSGQNAASATGTAAMNTGTSVGNALMAKGEAKASGIMGVGNALTSMGGGSSYGGVGNILSSVLGG